MEAQILISHENKKIATATPSFRPVSVTCFQRSHQKVIKISLQEGKSGDS